MIHDHPICECLCIQCDAANKHRRTAARAWAREALLEQAISWCRGRIEYLEALLAHGALGIIQSQMISFMLKMADEMDERRALDPTTDLETIAVELRATAHTLKKLSADGPRVIEYKEKR